MTLISSNDPFYRPKTAIDHPKNHHHQSINHQNIHPDHQLSQIDRQLYQNDLWVDDIQEDNQDEEDEEDQGMFSFAPPPENSNLNLNQNHSSNQSSNQFQNQNQNHSSNQNQNQFQNHHISNSISSSTFHLSLNNNNIHHDHSNLTSSKIIHSSNQISSHSNQNHPSVLLNHSISNSSSNYPPNLNLSILSPAATIAAQYQKNLNHSFPTFKSQPISISNTFPPKTTDSLDDSTTPVIELTTGFNAAVVHHQNNDHESVRSASTHSLNKLHYYKSQSNHLVNKHHLDSINPNPCFDNNLESSHLGMKELGKHPLESHFQLTHTLNGYNMDDYEIDEEDSPYPEVRASVSNIDDPEMPCLTFRAWVLGVFFVVFCGSLNMFFQLRYPAPFLTPIVVQIVAYPAGKLFATFLPDHVYRLPGGDGLKRNGFKGFLDKFWPSWLGAGAEWSFNPGPFNIKEHTVIAIMANAAAGPVYAVNLTLVMEKYYQRPPGSGFDFCLALATQLLGFSLAGITRRFLIWPASMIWPSNLVVCTLLNTFHAEDDDGSDGSLTRFKFFIYVAIGAFVWYWVPGYLFTALSTFSWVCWLAPRNRLLNQMFGSVNGLSLSFLSFDWSQIAYIGSPLVTPWWAEVNIMVGFVIFFYLFAPLLYYTNTWSQAYLPFGSPNVYDRYGRPYNTSKVVDLKTGTLNLTAYLEYSPLFLPSSFTSVYSIAFALATSAIVHTALYHGHSIWDKVKNIKTEDEDVHAKLMRNYPEVPDWWYWSYFVLFTGFSVIMIEVYDTGLPIWAFMVALFVALVYILPGGFILAMTSQQISINLVAEIIPGYILPGKPFSNMLFKTFSVQSLLVGLAFIQDLKLGHYMKIPPRVTFVVQIVAAVSSALVQIGVKKFLVSIIPDLCDKHQANLLTCPNTSVFYSASVLWGLLGPHRQFGQGTIYRPIVYFSLAGAIVPMAFYLMTKKWPNSWLKFVNLPVLLLGACWMPPATPINYTSWIFVGFIFQYVLRRTKFRWWSKYNFVLSAGLDVGTVISAVMIFFTLQLPNGGSIATLKWWGNTVYQNTDDFDGTPLYDPPAEGFGPKSWS
ncbi:hypothetical protein O181_065060 [Austropuccinia psidii MF-1]|uniref:OPT family small oligopeptide transporter n=1 Tax=Austropuccinia psidii MF-1 TaxID=1389203 RepID=A0A9Q3ELL3_9BASI|nr:hypothetical protein [Austropuccinia psidii MF-1]